MNLLILGPQGSGKGTQAALLAKKLGITHLSTGDILRKEIAASTDLGIQVKEVIEAGNLVSDELMNQLVEKSIKDSEGFILDGYPRTAAQAEFLDSITQLDHVIVLEVKDEVSLERITGRRMCARGHNYHIKYKPPQQVGVCDDDGLPLKSRADDTEEAVKKRLASYHTQTRPLVEHYREKIVEIDGEPSIEEVHKTVIKSIL